MTILTSSPYAVRLAFIATLVATTLQVSVATAHEHSNPLMLRGTVNVTASELEDELKEMDPVSVKQLESSSILMRDVLENIYIRKSLAAQASKLIENNEDMRRKFRIGQERQAAEFALKSMDADYKPDAAALLAYANSVYKAEPRRFQAPAAARVQHILFRANSLDDLCAALNKAKLVAKDLSSGTSFDDLAKLHSEDEQSAPKGGDLGYLTPDVLVPALDRAIAKLEKPGDTSPFVQTEAGIHIIRLIERKPSALKPFEEVKSVLMEEAANKLKSSARQGVINKLLANATFEDAAISAFTAARSPAKK